MSARIGLMASLLAAVTTLGGAAELTVGAPTPTSGPARVDVQMTSATLGDDCGGSIRVPTKSEKSDAAFDDMPGHKAKSKGVARRRCEQTSMQLSVVAPAGSRPTELHVKRVELLDESGRLVGELASRTPTVWNSGAYVAWNERVDPAASLSVSYALSQPDWSKVDDRWNQTFTIRATITVAGGDQTVQREVVAQAPTSLPPNVKT